MYLGCSFKEQSELMCQAFHPVLALVYVFTVPRKKKKPLDSFLTLHGRQCSSGLLLSHCMH